jgi:hypothetical protein
MAVGGELHEVDLAGSEIGGAPTPAMPASPASPPDEAPAETPKVVEKAPPEEKQPSAPAEKAPREEKKPSETAEKPPREEKKPSETAEKPPRKVRNVSATTEKAPSKERKPSETDEETTGSDEEPSPSAETPSKPSKASKATPKVASGEKNGGESAGSGGSFGAEGPASVRDLGRAFTRALPPACDADLIWGKLDVGKAGAVEVAVIISEEGKITGFEPITHNPPSHLLNTLKRTVALLRGGTFALQGGAVTAGRQILRLSAELSDTPAPAEEPSVAGAFNLASRWEGKRGVASFTQTSGRHVEITVEFLRVEITSGG